MGNHQSIATEGCPNPPRPLKSTDVRLTGNNHAMQVALAHYTPPNFPMIPLINEETLQHCKDSWQLIVESDEVEEGVTTSGVTLFYTEFYERLQLEDNTGEFEAVITRNMGGVMNNQMAAKGAILMRIIKFVLVIEGDTPANQKKLIELGKSHSKKHIRPWQYSVFINVLVATISQRLGTKASNIVMESWVNLFAYVVRTMLPYAIKNQIKETEIFINQNRNFDEMQAQAAEAAEKEKGKKIRKYIKNNVHQQYNKS